MQDVEELENASESYERPAYSYMDQGKYNGFNPFFAGNMDAPGKGADWNWLALYFNTTQSALQAGSQVTAQKLTSATIFNLYLPNMTPGSVFFAGSGGLVSQDNAKFIWDDANFQLDLAAGTATHPAYSFIGATGYGMFLSGGNQVGITINGTSELIAATSILYAMSGLISFSASGAAPRLYKDADGILAQRNGTNAQTFRVYNTFTDASNGEWLDIDWATTANSLIIRTRNNGTGTARNLLWRFGNSSLTAMSITPTTTSGVTICGSSQASAMAGGMLSLGGGATFSATSGTSLGLNGNTTFSDGGVNSSTVVQYSILAPTINYSAATKTGKVYLQYMNPTLTSQPTGNNAGLVFSSTLNSSTFPALHFNNQTDEDTNYERCIMSWGSQITNTFGILTVKGGTGTLRNLALFYSNTSTPALTIPTTITTDILLANVNTSAASTNGRVSVGRTAAVNATSGAHVELNVAGGFSTASTSTLSFYGIQVASGINYGNATPGAGYYYGLYIKPTNTALPTGISAAIALSSTASGINGIVWNNQTDEQTNYEQVRSFYTGNVWTLGAYNGGTGTLRGIQIGVTGNAVGFMGATPVTRPTVTGSDGGNAALASFLTGLANEGLITNSSTSGTGLSGPIFTATASVSLNNSAAETSMFGTGVGSKTIAANGLTAGRTVRVKIAGYFTTGLAPQNITAKIKLGTNVIASVTFAPITSATNLGWEVEGLMTCRTTGAGGTVFGQARIIMDSTTLTASLVDFAVATGTVAVDTTASQAVDITVTTALADAGSTYVSSNGTVEMLGG